LVELLSANSEFSYQLQKGLWEFSESLDHSFVRQSQLDFDPPDISGSLALSEVVVNKVQADRISKSGLMKTLNTASRRAAKGLDPNKQTVRQLVERFLEKASLKEATNVFRLLGVDVAEDPYLGGIDRKTGGEQ